jgi:predicted component of type VI protein secretion system
MYAWQQPYFEAVMETDDSKMPHHIMEAIASIEQRLLSPIDRNSEEFRALESTWFDVQELLNEHTFKSNADHSCSAAILSE